MQGVSATELRILQEKNDEGAVHIEVFLMCEYEDSHLGKASASSSPTTSSFHTARLHRCLRGAGGLAPVWWTPRKRECSPNGVKTKPTGAGEQRDQTPHRSRRRGPRRRNPAAPLRPVLIALHDEWKMPCLDIGEEFTS